MTPEAEVSPRLRVPIRLAFVVLVVAACVPACGDKLPPPLQHVRIGSLGAVLIGPERMTLYTFTKDKEPGKSACTGECLKSWTPFKPGANAPAPRAPLTLITLEDGSKQYAYKGKPLYYCAKDRKPGDANGHMLRGTWFVAKP